jgi:hypothetical protein
MVLLTDEGPQETSLLAQGDTINALPANAFLHLGCWHSRQGR